MHFGSAFKSDLESDVGLDNFLKIIVQQTNYSVTINESVFSSIKNQKLNYCVQDRLFLDLLYQTFQPI